jgi:predicted nucleic acid-binding protein
MLDANVLIAGSVWPRFPYEILRHAIAGDFQLVLSPLVLAEAHKHIQAAFPDTAPRLREVLELSSFEAVDDPSADQVAASTNLMRDVADIPIALAAINANVDYFVSSDKDFTDSNESIHQHLKVVLPGRFLREQMGWTSERLEAIRSRTWK